MCVIPIPTFNRSVGSGCSSSAVVHYVDYQMGDIQGICPRQHILPVVMRSLPEGQSFWVGREMVFFWEGRVGKRKYKGPCNSEVCRCTFVFSNSPVFMLYIM
jgi:hypothetical protein